MCRMWTRLDRPSQAPPKKLVLLALPGLDPRAARVRRADAPWRDGAVRCAPTEKKTLGAAVKPCPRLVKRRSEGLVEGGFWGCFG